jgi:hypothetical protein
MHHWIYYCSQLIDLTQIQQQMLKIFLTHVLTKVYQTQAWSSYCLFLVWPHVFFLQANIENYSLKHLMKLIQGELDGWPILDDLNGFESIGFMTVLQKLQKLRSNTLFTLTMLSDQENKYLKVNF